MANETYVQPHSHFYAKFKLLLRSGEVPLAHYRRSRDNPEEVEYSSSPAIQQVPNGKVIGRTPLDVSSQRHILSYPLLASLENTTKSVLYTLGVYL